MPEVSSNQFFKANPNQMALPGLESHSHPGAHALSQGFTFSHELYKSKVNKEHQTHILDLKGEDSPGGQSRVSSLEWAAKARRGYKKGEIEQVNTSGLERGKGLASALYGVAHEMTTLPPQHSANRTEVGNVWAHSVNKKYKQHMPERKEQ
jgi:hypothetical protein